MPRPASTPGCRLTHEVMLLLQILARLHATGRAHFDLKPDNIRIGMEQEAVPGSSVELTCIAVDDVAPFWLSVDLIDMGSSSRYGGKHQRLLCASPAEA